MFHIQHYSALTEGLTGYSVSPLYQAMNLQYQKLYMKSWLYEDLSFAVLRNKEPVAMFVLAAGTGPDGQKTLDAFGLPATGTIFNLPSQSRRPFERLVRNHVKGLISQYPDYTMRYVENYKEVSVVPLLMLDYEATLKNEFQSTIDLRLETEELHSLLRKSYKNLVNIARESFDIKIYGQESITWNVFSQFRNLHIAEAGRETRSLESWKKQFDMVQGGCGFLVSALLDGEPVGFSFFIHNAIKCYYSVGAYKRALFPKPISHGTLWEGILFAKQKGCHFLEMGQVFFSCDHEVDTKESNIGLFKRGFGGNISLNQQYILQPKVNHG